MTDASRPTPMHRGNHDTHRWHRRLALPLLVSLAAHVVPFAIRVPAPALPRIDVTLNPAVEFGLEAPPPSPPAPVPAAAPESPRPEPEHPPVRVERPSQRVREPIPPLPDPPSVRLREPAMAGIIETARDAGVIDESAVAMTDAGVIDESAVAVADAGVIDESAVAVADARVIDESAIAMTDAGVIDESAVAVADAGVTPRGRAVPSVASVAPDLINAIPQGSAVTVLLRMDRLRENPNGPRVASMLRAIPDWQAVLDGTELDPVADFDAILLATSRLFYRPGESPDVTAVIRAHAGREFLRASVEQMAGARAPSREDPDAGTLRDRIAHRDAGALPRASRPVWRRQGGVEVATIDRYLGTQTVMLLPDDLALIAPPARVPALLAMLRTPQGQALRARNGDDGSGLVTLLHGEGLRRLLRGPPTIVPLRAELAIFETRRGITPDGGARVLLRADFDSPEQVASAARLLDATVAALRDQLNAVRASPTQMLGAAALGVSLGELDDALEAIHTRGDEATLVMEAELTPAQVAQVLRVQSLAGLFQ